MRHWYCIVEILPFCILVRYVWICMYVARQANYSRTLLGNEWHPSFIHATPPTMLHLLSPSFLIHSHLITKHHVRRSRDHTTTPFPLGPAYLNTAHVPISSSLSASLAYLEGSTFLPSFLPSLTPFLPLHPSMKEN